MRRIPEFYARAADKFDGHVSAIADHQWDNDTPCSEWSVRDLLNHMVYENLWVPPLMEGQTVAEIGDRFEGDQLGNDPKKAWRDSLGAARTAITSPEALEGTVQLSRGETPAVQYAFELLIDMAVHGWDLARGIGADDRIYPDIAEFLYERLQPAEEMLAASGAFGTKVPVPDDADAQTKLLGLLGRKS